jgi:predicted transcriptional regulator
LLLEVLIREVPGGPDYPEGIRYRCYLGNPRTKDIVVLYDIHPGKPLHRHLRGREERYTFTSPEQLWGGLPRGCRSCFARRAMRVRRIKIGIKTWQENTAELGAVFHQLGKGKRPPAEETLYFHDLSTFRRCLTAKRMELLWITAEKRPQSVRELAALAGREPRNVSEDLDYLSSVGLIEFRPSGGRGKAKTPIVPYDRVDLSFDLRAQAA